MKHLMCTLHGLSSFSGSYFKSWTHESAALFTDNSMNIASHRVGWR